MMQMQRICLRHMRTASATDTPKFVQLRELCGHDELAVQGVDTRSAINLLARVLLLPGASYEQSVAEALAHAMSAADRDALLATLHRHCWGDRIVSTLCCKACSARFDLSFTLSELQRQLHAQGQRWLREKSTPEAWQAPAPPSGVQEIAAAELAYEGRTQDAMQVLLRQDSAPAVEDTPALVEELAQRLENCAPILDLELDAQCAECGHAQQAHFDVQSFVLQRLLNERDLLLHDIHTLAIGYGWPLGEILALPRSTRRSFAQLLSQKGAHSPRQRTADRHARQFWS